MALKLKKNGLALKKTTETMTAEEKAHYTPSPLIVVLAREKRKKPLSWYYQVVASVRGKRYAKVGYDDWYDEDQLVIIKRFRILPRLR